MQTTRLVQAVMLMIIVAIAASCATGKEYTSKLFAPRLQETKDSQQYVKTIRFLELDKLEGDSENYVSTDIIMGRDTASNTIALDNLAKTFPVNRGDTITVKPVKSDSAVVVAEKKPEPVETAPVARSANPGEVRNKRSREK